MKVADAMTPESDLVTVSLPGSRDDALEYLQEREFSSVPVVRATDEGERYRGLVSRDDLIEHPDEDDLALLMREVPTTTADATLHELAELMLEAGTRRVPVVEADDGGTLVGIVTITDVMRALAREDVATDAGVGDLCNGSVNTTYTGTPLPVAEREIGLADVPYTIALDDDTEMAGVLTEPDIVAVAEVVEGEEDAGASMAGDDEHWKWESIKSVGNRYVPTRNVEIPAEPVSEFMTEDVVTVSKGKSAVEAARLMITNDIEQIPVVSGGELAGVLRDVHLLEAV
ncbi:MULTISPECIES: CBS domain-containing protein [Halolamina]|uniref:CBS domain-containing protein n=1 Tax=Halolamina pelagica TaxID=699431 RepID=A0A1I5SMC3_9EURY|nr:MULTISPECIES: CBS domain-containing protein [Halolamina]NHX36985.1 CBS domain-containing protein [Halolamina sp. R1-12]SFP71900.1 CBS domain-containing protein [Halolamina pelagica]